MVSVKYEQSGDNLRVTLSRRNLMALLTKLNGYPPDSACTLTSGRLTVHAEEDSDHYADRPAGRGSPISPDTERAMGKGVNVEP